MLEAIEALPLAPSELMASVIGGEGENALVAALQASAALPQGLPSYDELLAPTSDQLHLSALSITTSSLGYAAVLHSDLTSLSDGGFDDPIGPLSTGNSDADGDGEADADIVVRGQRDRRHADGGGDAGSGTGTTSGTGSNSGDGAGGGSTPIRWTDPQQPTQNVCASDAITISVSGNHVTISGNISFTGAGAGDHTNSQLLGALNSTWSGTFGQYTVTTNVTVGDGGIVANVSSSLHGQPLGELGGSNIWTSTLSGAGQWEAEFTSDSFAHEFGHILGLIDLKDRLTGAIAPGYSNNIMFNSSASPTEQNIKDLLDQLNKGCSSA